MRLLSVHPIISLILTLVSVLSLYFVLRGAGEKHGLRKELEGMGSGVRESLAGNVEPHLEPPNLQTTSWGFGAAYFKPVSAALAA
jgi:hypothetical protein